MYPCATAYLSSCHPRSRSQVEPGDFCVRRGIFSRLGVKDGQKCPFKDSNVAALMRTTPWRVFGNHSSLTLLAKILLPLVSLPVTAHNKNGVDPQTCQVQPTISANRKCYGTTLHPNGPTIGANSPHTTARTHTPCKRAIPERGGRKLDCPIETLLGTVVGGNPLHHKAFRRLRLGRRPILFGTVAYRRRLRTGGLRPSAVPLYTVVRQSEGAEPVEK